MPLIDRDREFINKLAKSFKTLLIVNVLVNAGILGALVYGLIK